MKPFNLILQDASKNERLNNVVSFVGEDASGRFGILADHERFITCLVMGLAKFRTRDDTWHFLALPGAVLTFSMNTLTISTRKYLLDTDYTRISQALQDEILAEEEKLQSVKQSLHRMEEEIFRRMWEMGKPHGI